MAGWNKKSGPLVDYAPSEDELWSLFNHVFSDGSKKTNTYKFGLIKSICDQIYTLNEESDCFFLSYESLFAKFTENYWNLVNKYNIRQMRNNGNSDYSRVEILIKNVAINNNLPDNIPFTSLHEQIKTQLIKDVAKDCKRNVIGALYEDFQGKLYSFDLSGKGIYLSLAAYNFISKYKMDIEKLNYYSWARFLEKVNTDEVLVRILDKLDLSTPQRNDLSVYRELLYREFQENRCFYCGKKLDKTTIHVDHFIPWKFVKSDNLWNFVLACPKCNLTKHDNLVSKDYLLKLEKRNTVLIEYSGMESVRKTIEREFIGYYNGLLNSMWDYAKMGGIPEQIKMPTIV